MSWFEPSQNKKQKQIWKNQNQGFFREILDVWEKAARLYERARIGNYESRAQVCSLHFSTFFFSWLEFSAMKCVLVVFIEVQLIYNIY